MKPIPLHQHEVQGILAGRQTQIRRVVKPGLPDCRFDCLQLDPEVCYDGDVSKVETLCGLYAIFEAYGDYAVDFPICKAPFQPGEILWVRETWRYVDFQYTGTWSANVQYKADMSTGARLFWMDDEPKPTGWRPSIHMPKEAARLFLRVKDVQIERVQDISEDDAVAEGFEESWDFKRLWDKINAKRGHGWDKNPWVWVCEFEWIGKEAKG